MDVVVREEIVFASSPENVWQRFADINTMESFVGYGPIPGIAYAKWIEGNGAQGSVREVTNTDGSRHREEVVAFEPHHRMEDRIFGMTSPFRFLVREAHDSFEFSPDGDRTRLVRTFRFTLTSPLWWPVAALALAVFRRAVRRHHASVAARLPG